MSFVHGRGAPHNRGLSSTWENILTVRDVVETEGLPTLKEITTKPRGNETP